MRLLSREMDGYLAQGAWIRSIFELGLELKKKYGEDAVCDFSLGNPDLPPPAVVGESLSDLAGNAGRPFIFGYMPNPGYPQVREALAGYVSREQGVAVGSQDLLVTCGAAGGLNIFFRAVLEPGDEVICPTPYFVEYGFYVANSHGVLRPVPSREGDFGLDVAAIAAAVTDKTRAVLINSPNNPTGQVYPAAEITALANALTELSKGRERPIYLVADEPYRFLTFDGVTVPSVLPAYPYSVLVSSFSKNLSLAGERVGFVAVAPDMPGKEKLIGGLVFANRIMGFVNAPAIGQAILLKALGSQVDTSIYTRRRDRMAEVLTRTGYEFFKPRGAFYFFPKSPIPDEVAFVNALAGHRVLTVPGRGFGLPGYFRLAFCVDEAVILRAEEGLAKARAGI